MKLTDLPEVGELVVATVKDVKDFGVFITLDEYPNKTGFIHVSEVAAGWVKYIRDHVREGQKIVCKVMRVEPRKSQVDLSLKRVNERQRAEKIQEWKNEQKAEKLLGLVAKKIGKSLASCYKEFGMNIIQKYGSLYAAFEDVARAPSDFDKFGFKGAWVKHFVEIAQENIAPPSVEISGSLEISSNLPNGVKYVKEALLSAEESEHVRVQYVGAPRYRVVVKAEDYKTAERELARAVESAIKSIEKHGGKGSFTRGEK